MHVHCVVAPQHSHAARSVDSGSARFAEQKRSKAHAPANVTIALRGQRRVGRAEGDVTSPGLLTETDVRGKFKQVSGLDDVLSLGPTQVVVERISWIFRTVESIASPGGEVADIEDRQVAITCGNVRHAKFILPMATFGKREVAVVKNIDPEIESVMEPWGNCGIPTAAIHGGGVFQFLKWV